MAHKQLTLASLFDGSGGFPLGATLAGIQPIWASEIEPFPIRVTTKRFPNMTHYGDVSSINGADVPPVDILTFGSPCQDMSLAGKRAGLDGERSGLFHQAIRIAREMRGATNNVYPRFLVWENVPGAFSSNGGEDFRCVLEEICHTKSDDLHVPRPSNGKWSNAGEIVGDGFSVAWRTFDAQYWGVPQRRKRIYLVADFASRSAGKILFESEGLSGYSAEGFKSWQRAANSSKAGIGEASGTYGGLIAVATQQSNAEMYDNGICPTVTAAAGMSGNNQPYICYENQEQRNTLVLNDQGGNRMDITDDVTCTLRAESHHPPIVLKEVACEATDESRLASDIYVAHKATTSHIPLEYHPNDSRIGYEKGEAMQTLTSRMGTGGGNVPLLMEENTPPASSGEEKISIKEPIAYGISSYSSNAFKSSNPHSAIYEAETSRCLSTNGGDPSCNQGGMAVVALEGNGSRPSHRGDGYAETDKMYTLNTIERHGVAYCLDQGACKSHTAVTEEKTPPLTTDQTHAVAYGLDRASFNQGKNAKFDFSIQEECSPTIVAKGPGGVCHSVPIIQANESMMEEESIVKAKANMGNNDSTTGSVMTQPTHYTAGKASFFTLAHEESAGALVATDWKDPQIVNDVNTDGTDYIVRRLTPTECARLQGFPDWWCSDLETPDPTEEEIHFWADVFETHRQIIGNSTKPKTEKQIVKWLQDPHSDAAEYKLWGNGVALPNVNFVLSGIQWLVDQEDADE